MSESIKPELELFVKADETCIHNQIWKMVFYVLQQEGKINYSITPVSLSNPPEDYVKLDAGRTFPVAWIKSGCIDGEDLSFLKIMSLGSLEMLLMKLDYRNLNPSLAEDDVTRVEALVDDMYAQLMTFIRNGMDKGLNNRLTQLNEHLSCQNSGPFLLGDRISFLDCQIMPKLQHVRVLGKAYKKVDISKDLTHLWKYIGNMYETPAFIDTLEPDRDILMCHEKRTPLPNNIRPVLLGSTRLTEIPKFNDVACP